MKESTLLPFPISRGCPHSLTPGPFLYPQSQEWLVESFSHHITLKLTLLPPFSIF